MIFTLQCQFTDFAAAQAAAVVSFGREKRGSDANVMAQQLAKKATVELHMKGARRNL